MTLIDVHNLFSTDTKCRELLARLRWPMGVECPRCKMREVKKLDTDKELFWCAQCEYQFTVTAGTIFNDSHLPLLKWFVATYLMCESRKGISANQMKRVLGVSYKTAWFLCHRIRKAMEEMNQPMLDGTVEADETYVGGKKRGWGVYAGRHAKEIVVGIRQRDGGLRFVHVKDTKMKTLREVIEKHISVDADRIITDELGVYVPTLAKTYPGKHRTIKHRNRVYVKGDIHTNTVESAFSLMKRGIVGTWHRISKKHLQSYLNEMSFRFDRRKRPDLFVDTLRHMVTASALTFERLTA